MTDLIPYGQTSVYRYWERMEMPDAHTCNECARPIVKKDLVLTHEWSGMDDEDAGVTCAQCSHIYR